MGDVEGKETTTLLSAATYLKDNRLPPRGFLRSGQMASVTGIQGKAAGDMNFNAAGTEEGTGTDIVIYDIDVGEPRPAVTIRAQLLYQSSSPRFLADLLQDDAPAIARFREMYARADNYSLPRLFPYGLVAREGIQRVLITSLLVSTLDYEISIRIALSHLAFTPAMHMIGSWAIQPVSLI